MFAQRPATLLEAKVLAEDLQLTQSMGATHQVEKKKTIKVAQHSGTQEMRCGKLHQSVQMRTQMKTCRDRKPRQKIDSFRDGCKSSQKGAQEVSYPEVHGPAAVWRSILRDLP